MTAYTPAWMPIPVLAFLGTASLLVLCALAAILTTVTAQRAAARRAVTAGIALSSAYIIVLLGISFASREAVLPAGGWKYFCEADCHIAYSVAAVETAAAAGPEMQQVATRDPFVIVQLLTWFDPVTISPRRGDGPLTPNDRVAVLYDGRGHRIPESPRGAEVRKALGLNSTPLTQSLHPGERYVTYLVFETRLDPSQLRLWVGDTAGEQRMLWGAEPSPFHKKILFALSPAPTRLTRNDP